MAAYKRTIKKTCLLFGEGHREENFFVFLEGTERFKNRFSDWSIQTEHAQGEGCAVVLRKCIQVIEQREFDLVLCFIDTDKLIADYSTTHQKERVKLDNLAKEKGIKIIWQEENHEAELERATGGKITGKAGMKGRLKRHETRLINSQFVKKIFGHFGGFTGS